MKIMKAYKFRLQPTQKQIKQLSKEFGYAKFVWNRALIERDYASKNWGVSQSYVDLSRHNAHSLLMQQPTY